MESGTHVGLGTRGIPDARHPHRTRHHVRRTGSRVILIVLDIRRVHLRTAPGFLQSKCIPVESNVKVSLRHWGQVYCPSRIS